MLVGEGGRMATEEEEVEAGRGEKARAGQPLLRASQPAPSPKPPPAAAGRGWVRVTSQRQASG